MDYLDRNGIYDKSAIVSSVYDIENQIKEEESKEIIDDELLTKLRYEQMLRGIYLQSNPLDF